MEKKPEKPDNIPPKAENSAPADSGVIKAVKSLVPPPHLPKWKRVLAWVFAQKR